MPITRSRSPSPASEAVTSSQTSTPSPRRDHRPSRRPALRRPTQLPVPVRRDRSSIASEEKENSVNTSRGSRGARHVKQLLLSSTEPASTSERGRAVTKQRKGRLEFEAAAPVFLAADSQADSADRLEVHSPCDEEGTARRRGAGTTPFRNPLKDLSLSLSVTPSPVPHSAVADALRTPPQTQTSALERPVPASAYSALASRIGPPARVHGSDSARSPASIFNAIGALLDVDGSRSSRDDADLPVRVVGSMWRTPYSSRPASRSSSVRAERVPAPSAHPCVTEARRPDARRPDARRPEEGVSLARPFSRGASSGPFAPALVAPPRAVSAPAQPRRSEHAVVASALCSSSRSVSPRCEDSLVDALQETREMQPDETAGLEDLLGFNALPLSPSTRVSAALESRASEGRAEDTMLSGEMTALTLGSAVDGPPRLLVASRMRRRHDFEDVRELVFEAIDGAPTTLMLAFGNERDLSVVVRSQTVQMRFDPSAPALAEEEEAFSVRPLVLRMPPRREGTLFVTFAPRRLGVYSGVLKLKCRQKSFTFLLRGENAIVHSLPVPLPFPSAGAPHERARVSEVTVEVGDERAHASRAPLEANSAAISHAVRFDREDEEDSMCSQVREQRAYIRDWLTRSSSRSCRSAQRDQAPIAILPLMPEFSGTSSPDLYRATFELRNQTSIGISASLRTPYSFLQVDASATDIEPFSSRMVTVVFDRTMCVDSWDSLYVVVSLANGYERHVVICCSSIVFRGNKYTSPALEYEPQIRHRRLEKSVSIVSGLYFRRNIADFGEVVVGSLNRLKVELCNATDHAITVHLADPPLPFVLLHNEVLLRPRSYVRIPIRFIPIACTEFLAELTVQSHSGSHVLTLQLKGKASVFV